MTQYILFILITIHSHPVNYVLQTQEFNSRFSCTQVADGFNLEFKRKGIDGQARCTIK